MKNNKSKPTIIIVDEEDKIIGYKDRDIVKQEDIYRVSVLWISDDRGNILLAKRALTKVHNPGQWGPAVAGTNDKGETYKKNIHKEAQEELGLKKINPNIGPKLRIKGKHNYFCQWYLLKINKPINKFSIDPVEVAEIKWFKKEDLLKKIKINPDMFLKNMKDYLKLF